MAARKRSSTSTTNDAQPAARKAKAAARSPRPRPERGARRRIARARIAELAFEAIAIEGGLLSPEWLARVAQQKAPHQAESDYRVPKGLHLREELGRYWRIAQAHWQELTRGRAGGADPQALATRFVTSLLREVFGFASLAEVAPSLVGERGFPIGHAALGGHVPVVIAPLGVELDDPLPLFGDGQRRRSAFGLAQEYLGAHEGALWGLATSGLSLRILRDNPSLTRPAWVGVDLARIFTEERYADFAALWLLLHESRFGRVPAAGEAPEPASACPLEAWREAGRAEGTRAREHLRLGVEEALVALGQGFLAQADNAALREALSSGHLSLHAYFQELLRLVYRLIFLLAAEERGVLHPEGTSPEAAQLYEEGYGLRRLRDRAVRRSAHDRHGDLWESLKITLRALARGEPRLGLPALAGLFAPEQCPHLDGARLPNAALLLAVYKLAWLRQGAALERVNWRDMGPEELGSVYESLLELVPQLRGEPKQFGFATGGEAKGHARKTTGSYYTPDSLVQVLLDSALEPVVAQAIAANPGREAEALLELAIVDPACGSGHFLLSAARRLAAHVARLEANGTPSVKDYRHALRRVVGRCIYGVDLNPMAVELCKVALWMEAVEPGLPLGFLDAHVQQGNALLGTTPELMKSGIPDAAWDPIEGDDKKAASALKKKNKAAAKVEYDLFASRPSDGDEAQALARAVAELEAQSDNTPEALAKKESQWEALLASEAYQHQKLVADAWCAAFVWPKQPGELTEAAPTNELWRQLRDQKARPPALTVAKVRELATQYAFFHWHLQFPQVFQRGGFDVVLGNPPWIAHAGRAAQPLARGVKQFFITNYESFADYPTTHGIFVGHVPALLRLDGRTGLIIPSSVSELGGYAPARRAHDRVCDFDCELVDFGEGQFEGVTQPCMALASRRAHGGRAGGDHGSPWPMARPDLSALDRALLARMLALPEVPTDLFGERGVQSDKSLMEHFVASARPVDRFNCPIREGTDVREFELLPARFYVDRTALATRMRPEGDFRSVRILVRQTARYPIAALSDGVAFRNSVLAGFQLPGWPALAVVALLNSALVRWLHFMRFRDARQPVMPQVKIGHLRSIPGPPGGCERWSGELERIASKFMRPCSNGGSRGAVRAELDELVFTIYGLEDQERAAVAAWHSQYGPSSGRELDAGHEFDAPGGSEWA